MTRRTHSSPGFTLPEVLASIVIVASVIAVTAPLVTELAQSHRTASSQRSASDSLGTAIERIVRMIRKCPRDASTGLPDITVASASVIELSGADRIELSGSTLVLQAGGGASSPLLQNVTTFTLEYLSSDGVTNVMATPQQTQRVNITVATTDLEIRSTAWIRVARGGGA